MDGDFAPAAAAPPDAWLMLDVDAVGLGGDDDEEFVLLALLVLVVFAAFDWLVEDEATFDAAAVAVDVGFVIICSSMCFLSNYNLENELMFDSLGVMPLEPR